MDVNQISQLVKLMSSTATKSTAGVTGSDASSNFEALLNQIVNKTQDNTLNNVTTSVPGTDSKNVVVNGLDSLTSSSQKAQQLQQTIMQQMIKIMSSQDASIGTDTSATTNGQTETNQANAILSNR